MISRGTRLLQARALVVDDGLAKLDTSGVPMLMSGENFGAEDSAKIGYLRGLETWDRQFPGFAHVTEGAEIIGGTYHVLCVR
jgi:hypothetical protein